MLAQSGDRQRSGKRRLREGKRTAANRHSALRKCRNAVSAGVLSPISSAVGRKGAVGDKRNACAGARLHLIRHGFAVPPVSLRVGRSADLTGHRPVIQYREPLKGKAWGGAPLSNTGHSRGRLGGLYCALILLPALPNMSFQASSTLAAPSWASWASSSAVTSPSGVWPRISSAT